MNLTTEQLQAIENGEAVPMLIEDTECIVIRRDVYEQTRMLPYDDSELSDDERQAITAQTLDDLDSAGPIE